MQRDLILYPHGEVDRKRRDSGRRGSPNGRACDRRRPSGRLRIRSGHDAQIQAAAGSNGRRLIRLRGYRGAHPAHGLNHPLFQLLLTSLDPPCVIPFRGLDRFVGQ